MSFEYVQSLERDRARLANLVTPYNSSVSSSSSFTKLVNAMDNTMFSYPLSYFSMAYAPNSSYNLVNYNVSRLTSLAGCFYNCTSLTNVDVSTWKTNNVTNLFWLFANDQKLNNVSSLANWNTLNVRNMNGMFAYCMNLTNLGALNSWKMNNVSDLTNAFFYCNNITTMPNFRQWNLANLRTFENGFNYCNNITDINFSNVNMGQTANTIRMFYGCRNLQSVNFYNTNLNGLQNASFMFYSCYNLKTTNLDWKTSNSLINVKNMFADCTNLTTINVSNLTMNNVTDASYLFRGCAQLTTISGFTNWNTSKLNNLYRAFYLCNNLSQSTLNYLVNMLPPASQMLNKYVSNMGLNIYDLTYNQLYILNNKGYLDAVIPAYNIYIE